MLVSVEIRVATPLAMCVPPRTTRSPATTWPSLTRTSFQARPRGCLSQKRRSTHLEISGHSAVVLACGRCPANSSLWDNGDSIVSDPDIVAELVKRHEGLERDRYAASALRLGILARRDARGELDVEAIRHEGERLVSEIQLVLNEHALIHQTSGSGRTLAKRGPSGGL